MIDDKYIIAPASIDGYIIPYWIIIDCYGAVELVGPYCQWPKTEPRIFEVNYEKLS